MKPPETLSRPVRGQVRRWLAAGLATALAALLAWAVWSLPAQSAGLASQVRQELPRSGAQNPVTAVVLNFRGYDTLLEIAVLLLAVLGVWSLAAAETGRGGPPAGPVLAAAVRWLVPLMIFVAGYLLWIGSFAPGGAFQGGAVLGGAAVLVLLSDVGRRGLPSEGWWRLGLSLGLAVFVGVAAGCLLTQGRLLAYPEATAGRWILAIETACLISIGLTLAALFVGGRPPSPTATPTAAPGSPLPSPAQRPPAGVGPAKRHHPLPNRPPRRAPRGPSGPIA